MDGKDKSAVRMGAIGEIGQTLGKSRESIVEETQRNRGALEFISDFMAPLADIHRTIDKEMAGEKNLDHVADCKKYVTLAMHKLEQAKARLRERQIELSGELKHNTKAINVLQAMVTREEAKLEDGGKSKAATNIEKARKKRRARTAKPVEVTNGSH